MSVMDNADFGQAADDYDATGPALPASYSPFHTASGG
jgi:hypothetical protein